MSIDPNRPYVVNPIEFGLRKSSQETPEVIGRQQETKSTSAEGRKDMSGDTQQTLLASLGSQNQVALPTVEPPTCEAAEPPVVDLTADGFSDRYCAYREWCERIGIFPATFIGWERINRKIAEDSFSFAPPKRRKRKRRSIDL
jgi:hypothetical protein